MSGFVLHASTWFLMDINGASKDHYARVLSGDYFSVSATDPFESPSQPIIVSSRNAPYRCVRQPKTAFTENRFPLN